MDAKIKKESGIHVVTLSGRLNHDAIDSFRSICLRYLYNEDVIFQMKELDFVGSTGITFFVDALKSFVEKSDKKINFVHAKSEFMKIFDVHLAFNTSYYSSVEMAKVSFFLPQISAEQRAPSQEVFQDPFREILDESIPSDLEGV